LRKVCKAKVDLNSTSEAGPSGSNGARFRSAADIHSIPDPSKAGEVKETESKESTN